MQEPTQTRGIHHEISGDLDPFAMTGSAQAHPLGFLAALDQHRLIPVGHTQVLRLANQMVIEVRAKPMGVGNFFIRTCAHQELMPAFYIACEWPAKLMMVKSEPAFQT